MITELRDIRNTIFKLSGLEMTDALKDKGSEEYFGHNFQIDRLKVKYRKAKVTPKKVGYFVTLWKRNDENQTEPFHIKDDLDFCIIAIEGTDESGFFCFPKNALAQNGILTRDEKQGKRGFRVYPDWTNVASKQAAKTKAWQSGYFINPENERESILKFRRLLGAK